MSNMNNVKSAGIMDLQAALTRGEKVVDVRERHEYDAGHVPEAVHIPMSVIPLRMNEIDMKDPVWLICESGSRSWQAADYLTRHGYPVINVEGGTSAWRANGLPVQK